jgi:hypothetical protein
MPSPDIAWRFFCSRAYIIAGWLPSQNSLTAPTVDSQLSNLSHWFSLYSFESDHTGNTISHRSSSAVVYQWLTWHLSIPSYSVMSRYLWKWTGNIVSEWSGKNVKLSVAYFEDPLQQLPGTEYKHKNLNQDRDLLNMSQEWYEGSLS